MARRMRVEYSESTGLVGKPQTQKSRDKEQPRSIEGKSEQDVDMHDSSTSKKGFDRKEDSDDRDDDVSKNVVL